MVAIEYSRNAINRFIAKGSALLLIFVGFFALLFTATPKMFSNPYASNGNAPAPGGILNVAHADAPACGGGGCSGGDCAGGGDSACSGDSGDSCCGCGGCGCDGGDCGDSY